MIIKELWFWTKGLTVMSGLYVLVVVFAATPAQALLEGSVTGQDILDNVIMSLVCGIVIWTIVMIYVLMSYVYSKLIKEK